MEHGKLFTWPSLVLALACVALNLLGAGLAPLTGAPLFLDSVGTILGAALGGYLLGISVGFFSNVLNSLFDPITLYYGVLSVGIALLAAALARRGVFRSFGATLLSALGFAVIGGACGSLMTWGLYGLHIGEGVSAPFALLLNSKTGLGPFLSQFLADCGIDVLDKVLTVSVVFFILRLLPARVFRLLPMGEHYDLPAEKPGAFPEASVAAAMNHTTFSLRNKVATIIVITATVISVLAITVSMIVYTKTMNKRFVELGQSAARLVLNELNGDELRDYLASGKTNARYDAIKARLTQIRDSFKDVKYLYVYEMTEDGVRVVFDLDTPELPGEKLGAVIDFDISFLPHLPALLAGQEIPPIVSNDQYGWLLTIYRPVRDSRGWCVAYAAVDIAMDDVMADRYAFAFRMVALLFGVSILIVAFSFWYAQNKLVIPINALATATSKFAYDSGAHRDKSAARLQALSIQTGDEIENLYRAISKTTSDVSHFISVIDEQSALVRDKAALIAQMQDNIIISFATMVEFRDANTGSHIRHTAAYVRALAGALYARGYCRDLLTPEFRAKLVKSAPLHDVGKITVSDAILNKPGRLTDEEFTLMKRHTTAGGRILREALVGIRDDTGDNYLTVAINMATSHHEKWDGAGYPAGLKGEAIPLCARIMAVADVFDALITRRSYKEPFPFERAMQIIRDGAGTHFDPVLAETFVGIADEIRRIVAEG